MSCLSPQALGAYEARLLDESERAAAGAHLDACPRCRERREKLLGTLALLAAPEPAPEIAPKPATWDAIATRITATEPALAVAIACIYCKGRLARIDAVYCAGCLAPHHADCWEEHGACASCNVATLVRAERPRVRRPRTFRWPFLAALAVAGASGTIAALVEREVPAPIPSRGAHVAPEETAARVDAPGLVQERPKSWAEARLDEADKLLLQGNFQGARDLAEEVLAKNDADWRAFMIRGRAKDGLGDAPGAEDDLTEAIDLEPSTPEGYYWRGTHFLRLGKLAEAVKDFEVALTRSSDYLPAHVALGCALERQLDDDGAADQYQAVLESPDATDMLRDTAAVSRARLLAIKSDRGEVLSEVDLKDRTEKASAGSASRMPLGDLVASGGAERAKRIETARRLYDEVLKRQPDWILALMGRAKVELAQGALDEAAADLARAASWFKGAAPSNEIFVQIRNLQGRVALAKKDWEGAIRSFESALSSDSGDPCATAGLAHAYLGRDGADSPEARGLFRKAHGLKTKDTETAGFEAALARHADDAARSKKVEFYALARRAGARLIDRNPFGAEAYVKRGRAAAQWGDWDFALRDANAAIQADPQCADAWMLRGFLYGRDLPLVRDEVTQRPLRLRDYDQAIADFKRAIEIAENERQKARARYGMALALLAAGRSSPLAASRSAEARQSIGHALGAIPAGLIDSMDDERWPLDQVLEAIEVHDLAAKLEHPLARNDIHELAKAAAARAHERAKNLRDRRSYTEAIEALDRAMALDPTRADAVYDRGTCYLKIGNFVPGILDFSRALELNPRFTDQFYNKVYQVSYVVDLNRVIAELNKIVAEHPDVSYVVFLRGFFYVSKTEFKKYDGKDLEAGIADFDRTIAINPKHASAYLYRGFLYYKAALITEGQEKDKKFDLAMKDYNEAWARDPQSGIAHFLMAMVWSVKSEDKEIDEAEKTKRRDEAVRELTVSIIEKDFKGFDRIKNDKAFEAVRNDPRVLKLVQGR